MCQDTSPFSTELSYFLLTTLLGLKVLNAFIVAIVYKNSQNRAGTGVVNKCMNNDAGFLAVQEGELMRGDFVVLYRNQMVPCDCLILDSDDKYLSNYVAYFNESFRDGDSNLVIKKSLNGTKDLKDLDVETNCYSADFLDFRKKLSGTIEYSKPSVGYENFEAFVKFCKDPKTEKATIENLATKGSVLKSGLMIGLVLYVGDECGLMEDCTKEFEMALGRFGISPIEKWTDTLLKYSSIG